MKSESSNDSLDVDMSDSSSGYRYVSDSQFASASSYQSSLTASEQASSYGQTSASRPSSAGNQFSPEQRTPYHYPYGKADNESRHKHTGWKWFTVIAVCLCLGWFGCDTIGNSGDRAQPQKVVTHKTIVEKAVPQRQQANGNSQSQSSQQSANGKPTTPSQDVSGKVGQLQNKLNDMGISAQNQEKALQFFERQSTDQQHHIVALTNIVAHLVPGNQLKQDVIGHIFNEK